MTKPSSMASVLSRNQSMQAAPPPKPHSPPSFQFPTSPQLILGEDMTHFAHPQHPLSKVNLPDLFTCAGCKEYGAGKRFTCQECDFQLHDFCALRPSKVIKLHPFHYQHNLHFNPKPLKAGIAKSKCDACRKPVTGFAFRCKACSNFQIHPSCATLSGELLFPSHPHVLRLMPTMTTSGGDDGELACGECKRRRSGRVYRCTVCEYRLHVVCAKSVVNGLLDNGIQGREKPSVLGTVVRLASQVVVSFVGGLIEGLGEGVGQALVQNIGKEGVTATATAAEGRSKKGKRQACPKGL
ncbi:hypothetical protein MLD38_022142 [Melastoma candidum]|uniref:Uncharacterized protein n=1 Tax=Melastoma candidum TaxID=119954 RepID=A0ACB9QLQ7_9MYRT|nr:hypothetical protein MLD38_022142 [Melastoma candidum]